jgi:Family of unknown function (DUF6399)
MANKYTRTIVAEKLEELNRLQEACSGTSERQLIEIVGIPRGTLHHWQARQENIDADPDVAAFFALPAGVAFLHRLVLAFHFVNSFLGAGGVRLVCTYLELSGLAQFVASSYSPQRKVSVEIEKQICAFEKEEDARLATGMKPKQICVAQDETEHERSCLVAIEPVSNYILLEKYAGNRQAETWSKEMSEAVVGKPLEIVQSTSDEGRGITSHVKNGLGAHHAPDVFHVQQEISRATSGSLAGKIRQAEKEVERAEQKVKGQEAAKTKYYAQKQGRGRPPSFDKRIENARQEKKQATENLITRQEQQERARKANKAISGVYHPYNLQTGEAQETETVDKALQAQFKELETIVAETGLRESSQQRIEKAKRVVVGMVATIAFFWLTVTAKIEALGLAEETERMVFEKLLPAYYLSIVAGKTKDIAQREQLKQKSEEFIAMVRNKDSPIQRLSVAEQQTLDTVAWECVHLFQPSSSCVEGRNGQLALRHHALHRLSDRKLNALKVVHNFHLRRQDRTTAAERFFGKAPKELFSYLLERVDLPGFPAQKRPHIEQKISLFTPENTCLA